MEVLGGAAEIGAGYGMTFASGLVAAPIGHVVVVHGIDHFTTGLYSVITGKHKSSATQLALQSAGVSAETSSAVDAGLSVVGMGAGALTEAKLVAVVLTPKFKQIQQLELAAEDAAASRAMKISTSAEGLAGPRIAGPAEKLATRNAGGGQALAEEALTTTRAKDIKAPNISGKNTDVYVPDRPLPRDPRTREPVPEVNVPHTELGTKEGTKGKYPQAREFDAQGKPVKDIDFTDHGRPQNHPNPHEHRWKPNPTGGTPQRSPEAEPLTK